MTVDVRIEPLVFLLDTGLYELSKKCWAEIGASNGNSSYNPDWPEYKAMEDENKLRFVSLRENGNLIGYASIILDKDAHAQGNTVATIFDIYVSPDKTGHSVKLFRYIEKIVLELGTTSLIVASQIGCGRSKNRNSKFLKFMGYAPQQVHWVKRLGNDGDA